MLQVTSWTREHSALDNCGVLVWIAVNKASLEGLLGPASSTSQRPFSSHLSRYGIITITSEDDGIEVRGGEISHSGSIDERWESWLWAHPTGPSKGPFLVTYLYNCSHWPQGLNHALSTLFLFLWCHLLESKEGPRRMTSVFVPHWSSCSKWQCRMCTYMWLILQLFRWTEDICLIKVCFRVLGLYLH